MILFYTNHTCHTHVSAYHHGRSQDSHQVPAVIVIAATNQSSLTLKLKILTLTPFFKLKLKVLTQTQYFEFELNLSTNSDF